LRYNKAHVLLLFLLIGLTALSKYLALDHKDKVTDMVPKVDFTIEV